MGLSTNVKCKYVSRYRILHHKILGHEDLTKKDLNYGCGYLDSTLMNNKLTLLRVQNSSQGAKFSVIEGRLSTLLICFSPMTLLSFVRQRRST